ncbi:MAG: hypothetical protein LC802_17265 [Acidobacteria bacterium]|nr:hypothetical protein [Acidobacteriota bacterium]
MLGLFIAFGAFMLWSAAKTEKEETKAKVASANAGNTGESRAVNQNVAGGDSRAQRPTPSPSPPQQIQNPIDLSLVKSEVITALEGWATATRGHDLDAHMSYYADSLSTYYNRNSVSSAYVRSDRARAFTRFYRLDVQLANITVSPDPSGVFATATFDKTWNFEGEKYSSGAVRQMAWLSKVNDHWLITGEKDLKVIYVNR